MQGMFYESLNSVLGSAGSEQVRAFWSLLLVGESASASAWGLGRLFMHTGLIHLLVLSGSQIEHFRNLLIFPLGIFGKLLGVSRSHVVWRMAKWGVLGVLFFYVWDVGEGAPLVRAVLLRLVIDLGFQEQRREWGVAFVGVLHMLCFPEHLQSLSFYLSWVAYLSLLVLGRFKMSTMTLLVVMSLVCQFVVSFLKASALPSWEYLILSCCVNVLMIPLFEKLIFPMGASLLLFALIKMSLPVAMFAHPFMGGFFDSLRILYELPVELVLGVLKGIRYI